METIYLYGKVHLKALFFPCATGRYCIFKYSPVLAKVAMAFEIYHKSLGVLAVSALKTEKLIPIPVLSLNELWLN